MTAAVILCPMQHERRVLSRALRGMVDPEIRWSIHVVGIGERSTHRAEQIIRDDEPLVILAGLAGALTDDHAIGDATWIREVRDAEAGTFISRPIIPESTEGGAVITSTECAVRSTQQREQLAAGSGASLVDMESVHIARLAEQRGWRFAIVRGVSDDLSVTLPSSIDQWTSPAGTVRPLRIVRAIVSGDVSLTGLRQMQQASAAALHAAAALIGAMLMTESQNEKPATMGSPPMPVPPPRR